jgi:hypothetical protein
VEVRRLGNAEADRMYEAEEVKKKKRAETETRVWF